MESTAKRLVKRSDNVFLPFSTSRGIGKDIPFSNDSTLFATITDNGNVHIHGKKSVADSGWVLITNFSKTMVLETGKTYAYSCTKSYGNCSLQYINSEKKRVSCLSTSVTTITPTEDITISHLCIDTRSTSSSDNIGKSYDYYLNIMLVEGSTPVDYQPYYTEYEATRQVLVRRSDNIFLPFSSESQYAIGKDIAFSSDSTLFATIMDDGNIHIHGKRSAENSGYVLLWSLTQGLVLKAGSTYNFSISATSPVQCIIQSNQSGTRTNIIQVGPNYVNGTVKTMTEDTTITHVYMAISAQASTAVGDTIDAYVNPMLVEGSARQDYEPYYKEYESTSTKLNEK